MTNYDYQPMGPVQQRREQDEPESFAMPLKTPATNPRYGWCSRGAGGTTLDDSRSIGGGNGSNNRCGWSENSVGSKTRI